MKRLWIDRWPQSVAAVSLGAFLVACGGGSPGGASSAPVADDKVAGETQPPQTSDAWKPSIRTATLPQNLCDLMPVAEVEAILGPLAELPRQQDGCRYILAVPEAVLARRQRDKAAREKFGKAFGLPASTQEGSGSTLDAQQDPRSYSVTVNIDLDAASEGNIASGDSGADGHWDEVRRARSGLYGRVGHVRITASRQSPDVPSEPIHALAERVRELVPDLPFAVTNPYQVIQLTDGDPCGLLTRDEVEAVVGPLALDPYRSSSEWPALAHGAGHACAYYAPGHRVFAVSPEWSGGAAAFAIAKGVGGLVGILVPQPPVAIEGPWDRAHAHKAGALMFLKGDRLLEVYYGTSRATRGDAVELAATAMRRLAP